MVIFPTLIFLHFSSHNRFICPDINISILTLFSSPTAPVWMAVHFLLSDFSLLSAIYKNATQQVEHRHRQGWAGRLARQLAFYRSRKGGKPKRNESKLSIVTPMDVMRGGGRKRASFWEFKRLEFPSIFDRLEKWFGFKWAFLIFLIVHSVYLSINLFLRENVREFAHAQRHV